MIYLSIALFTMTAVQIIEKRNEIIFLTYIFIYDG